MTIKYQALNDYTFIAEDDWGCYFNGAKIYPKFKKIGGYAYYGYNCNDGKVHTMDEHRVKWVYFNGEIPEGYEIDHILPIKNGGTNKLSNLRCVSHKDNCNNEYSRKNYSEANIGEKNHNYGKHLSKETRMKISESKKGEKHDEKWFEKMINNPLLSKEIIGFDENGIEICRFPSVEEASRNGYSRHIAECANGKRNKSNNLYWKWAK